MINNLSVSMVYSRDHVVCIVESCDHVVSVMDSRARIVLRHTLTLYNSANGNDLFKWGVYVTQFCALTIDHLTYLGRKTKQSYLEYSLNVNRKI